MDFQTLVVEGIEQKDNRIVVKSAGLSYSFFKLKKDGQESRAFQDFTRLNVQIGQAYSFGVSESQGEYNGKPVVYRNIAVISEARNQPVQQNTPQTVPTQPQTQQAPPTPQNVSVEGDVNTNFQKLTSKIQDLEKRVEGLETYIHQEKENGKEGLDLHQSFEAGKPNALKDEDIPIIDIDEDVNSEDVPF